MSHIQSIAEPGIRAPGHVAHGLRAELARLLGRRQTSFPGAQPVSFARQHLTELTKQDYYVCEKSDGIRYLLYLTEDENHNETQYLIDRKNDYWFIDNKNLHFPKEDDRQAFHTHTLIDGELVIDNMGGGKRVPRFLVFDCLIIDGKNLMERPLDKRLAYFKVQIYQPYKALFTEFPGELQYQPFEVEMKSMQLSYGIEMMFKEIFPQLKHGNDGLIFTCKNTNYCPGTDTHILKWKPPQDNTIDCRLKLFFATVEPDEIDIQEGIDEPYTDYDAVPRSELWAFTGEGGPSRYQYFAAVHITDEEWERLKALRDPLNNRVVECYQDEHERWRISRFRDDKPEANHISTLHSVMKSIEDRVTEQDLKDSAKGIRDAWKAREKERPRQS